VTPLALLFIRIVCMLLIAPASHYHLTRRLGFTGRLGTDVDRFRNVFGISATTSPLDQFAWSVCWC